MDAKKKIIEFPDVENKLHAPTKKSLFEKQKADAEAKRLRAEAETAAVYNDFVKSFDDENDAAEPPSRNAGFRASSGFGGPSKRHYTSGSTTAGPSIGRGPFGAARGSGPGSLGVTPIGLSRKRTLDGFQQTPRRDNDRGLLAFDDYNSGPVAPSKAFHNSDDEEEQTVAGKRNPEPTVAKPTIRLASLPPGTSPAVIKALLPSNLTADAIRILPPPPQNTSNTTERKSISAIVTLAKDTAANDIDAAVNTLQNRYLGFGFYLSLHRHLSSAAISSTAVVTGGLSAGNSQPFGAKPVDLGQAGRGHAPGNNRFAPPTSYAPNGSNQTSRSGPLLHVPVKPPRDIRELQLIHKTIESLLTHGPEFEALLMSRQDVQREERWAWIWDARSTGGIWYRWRFWQILTGAVTRRGQAKYLPLFEDSSAWKAPELTLAYEYATRLDEFVSDSEYNSSDDDESGDEGGRRHHHRGGGPPDPSNLDNEDGAAYLNPLEKAKLTHLLARLPTSTGKLRKGDVARVTAFAISHAGRGADEVVAAIVANVEKPFAYTSANPERKRDKERAQSGDEAAGVDEDGAHDSSSASLIGLYIVSDILSSSSTSGVRHAWRYRSLFESVFKRKHVFESLGRMEKKLNWGRLRAEKWKRSVGNVLSLWEGWCVFPQRSQEHFVDMFNNPPATQAEELEKQKEAAMPSKGKNKWRTVDESTAAPEGNSATTAGGEPRDMGDEDLDGEPMDEDENLDGEPMDSDEDLDGEPMDEDPGGEPMEGDDGGRSDAMPAAAADDSSQLPDAASGGSAKVASDSGGGAKRSRPKAVDMFADSDEE